MHSVKVGWGLAASDAAAVNVFRVYKDVSAGEKWYQTVRIEFSPGSDLPV